MTQITEEQHDLNVAIFDAGFPKDIRWEAILSVVMKCRRANPTLTMDQALAIVKGAYESRILDQTLKLTEEVRRWRYNLVESGVLDIEGKPLVF